MLYGQKLSPLFTASLYLRVSAFCLKVHLRACSTVFKMVSSSSVFYFCMLLGVLSMLQAYVVRALCSRVDSLTHHLLEMDRYIMGSLLPRISYCEQHVTQQAATNRQFSDWFHRLWKNIIDTQVDASTSMAFPEHPPCHPPTVQVAKAPDSDSEDPWRGLRCEVSNP